MFAFHENGTVDAITSEGITAWTADVSQGNYWYPGYILPDFRGGLVFHKWDDDCGLCSVVKLDGATGQAITLHTRPSNADWHYARLGVHPDGTILTTIEEQIGPSYAVRVLGFNPSGGQKFSVATPAISGYPGWFFTYGMIVAGDGYAYVPYSYMKYDVSLGYQSNHLRLLRIDSAGASSEIGLYDWTSTDNSSGPMVYDVNLITNADQGVLASWQSIYSLTWDAPVEYQRHMANVSGGGASVGSLPGTSEYMDRVATVLQLEDGSFIGAVWDDYGAIKSMFAFDASGALRWSVAGYTPKIATADGGVIATTESGSAVTFDSTGAATGQMRRFFTQSWVGNTYEIGSILRRALIPIALTTSFAAAVDRPAAEPLPDRVKAMEDVVMGTPSLVLRTVWYRLYQGNNSYAPQNRAVIREVHRNTYGPHPPTSASLEGKEFEDDISTMGSGDFGLTQQFVVENIPGIRPYTVQMIVPCIANPGLVPPVKFGAPVPENVIRATSLAVLINGDAGSTDGRNCRYIQ